MTGKYLILCVVISLSCGVLGSNIPFGSRNFLGKSHQRDDVSEDANLDVIGLLTKYGYPSETHEVRTSDGYFLTMHRITGTKDEIVTEDSLSAKPVIFLMHGLLGSSADWITAGTSVGFAYQLADEGFDVWMGNARGNHYSRRHSSLDPSQATFWRFSWDEIGHQDLPSMIDNVLEVTGKSQLHFIGHSQGSTAFFVMASRRPEYNAKIRSMHAFGPLGYMSNLASPLMKVLAQNEDAVEAYLGEDELLPNSDLMTIAGGLLCSEDTIFQPVCSNILFLLFGSSPELHNSTNLPVILGHTPAGSSTRQLIHYIQEVNSGRFRRFDYGRALNIINYGALSPPAYDLSQVTAAVFLHYADNDWMANVEDIRQLNRELGTPVGLFRVPHDQFNHLDFLWAVEVRSILYNRVIELIRAFD